MSAWVPAGEDPRIGGAEGEWTAHPPYAAGRTSCAHLSPGEDWVFSATCPDLDVCPQDGPLFLEPMSFRQNFPVAVKGGGVACLRVGVLADHGGLVNPRRLPFRARVPVPCLLL